MVMMNGVFKEGAAREAKGRGMSRSLKGEAEWLTGTFFVHNS